VVPQPLIVKAMSRPLRADVDAAFWDDLRRGRVPRREGAAHSVTLARAAHEKGRARVTRGRPSRTGARAGLSP
jgi:hypothetical protein